MLIYLVFNNLTIIFQVPRLLLWQMSWRSTLQPHRQLSAITWDGSVTPICWNLLSVYISEHHLLGSESIGGVVPGQDVGVNLVRATLWVGLQSWLGDFVYCLCFESPRCWCQCVTDIGVCPMSSPQPSFSLPCLQLPLTPAPLQSLLSGSVGTHTSPNRRAPPHKLPSCVKTFLPASAILLVLLHIGVNAAEDCLEKVVAKEKVRRNRECCSQLLLIGYWLTVASGAEKVGGGEGSCVTPPFSLNYYKGLL